MDTEYLKGGRGKKAPYQSKTIRVPVDLESEVERLIEEYRVNGCLSPVQVEIDLIDEYLKEHNLEMKNTRDYTQLRKYSQWLSSQTGPSPSPRV